MFTIKKFNDLEINEFYEIVKARYEVFACEQKITMFNDYDDIDKDSYHIFSMKDGLVTAYARIIPKEFSHYDDVSIGRVLVTMAGRRQGLATEMMKEAIKFVKEELKEEHITLSAQNYIKDLYKNLGFVEISDIYNECDIPHVKMRL